MMVGIPDQAGSREESSVIRLKLMCVPSGKASALAPLEVL